jgi:hypothetical protein
MRDMGYELKWGNRTWIYGLLLGLGIGLPILLFMYNMKGASFFFNYYSPMLGYYVLISICQSHYFRRPTEPQMNGLFRQFVSIFGAVLIFFVNEMIMIHILGLPTSDHALLNNGGIVMSGHFTFIVFGFFIYGFDDFMFKGRLLSWMKNDTAKAIFWYFVIWLIWLPLFYMKGGVVQAFSAATFDELHSNRMLSISQWAIIMSLMIALIFKDYIPELKIENDLLRGVILLAGSFIIGGAIAYICYGLTEFVAPWGDISATDRWHHVLYMGTYPLIPVILMGVYSKNFSDVESPGMRVVWRLVYLVPLIVLTYFLYHFVIAQPELIPNWIFGDGTFSEGMGIFGEQHGWHHHLDLYFNFTISIIPLTHHWFCGKAGFMKESEDEPVGPGQRRPWGRPERPAPRKEAIPGDRRTSPFGRGPPPRDERGQFNRQWK